MLDLRWWTIRGCGGLKDLLNLRLVFHMSLEGLTRANGCDTESIGANVEWLAGMQLCNVALDAAVD
jgi:hypothetical protein